MAAPAYVSGSSNWGRALQANIEMVGGIVTGSTNKEFVSIATAYEAAQSDSNPTIYLSSSFAGSSGSIIQALNHLKESSAGKDELSELEDVNFSGLADGNVFLYDADTSKWQNKVLSGDATIVDTGAITLAGTNTNLTTLANVTTVGALGAGSIAAGFGNIDNGTNNITTGGKVAIDVLGTDIDAAGAITFGLAQQGAVYAEAAGLVLDAKTGLDVEFHVAGTKVAAIDDDGMDLVAGDEYLIAGTSVLNATTLGSAVVASSLTSVGTLTSGVWNAGAIDNGTSTIQTGGKLVIDVAGTAIDAVGALTVGLAQEGGVYGTSAGLVLDAAAGKDVNFHIAGTKVAAIDADGMDLVSGDAYLIDGDSVLNATTLGGAVVGSSLTSVGTIATGVWSATDIAVAHGGTGASTAAAARTNLGVAIGTDVQAHGDVLDDFNTLGAASGAGLLITSSGAGTFAYSDSSAVLSLLGLSTSDSPQFTGLTLTGRLAVGSSGGATNQIYLWGTDASGNPEQYSINVTGGVLNVGLA